jgi:hypothetical protein
MHQQDWRPSSAYQRTSGGANSFEPPPWRDAEDDNSSGLDGRGERLLGRFHKHRLAFDLDNALKRERGVGEQPAGVPPPVA